MPGDVSPSIYRVLDASANRAGEGLRSLEEFARFVLDNTQATAELKSIRHDLAALVARFPRSPLLAARDTELDVGTGITEPSETIRSDGADVVAAAASRAQQSLRVLEEYGKLIDPEAAGQIEQLRYRCYTIAASIELCIPRNDRRERLAQSTLYVLVDAGNSEQSFSKSVCALIAGGADVLQLRDRDRDDRTLIARARIGTKIANEAGALFIVNDRADLALAAGADGVHVGQQELPASLARQIVGQSRLVGVSTHSIAQAQTAVADGADYIGCGPVFPGKTKSFDDYVGTHFLRELNGTIKIPAFAIGGIGLTNVHEIVAAGFDRIAVAGAVRDAADPTSAAAALKSKLLADR